MPVGVRCPRSAVRRVSLFALIVAAVAVSASAQNQGAAGSSSGRGAAGGGLLWEVATQHYDTQIDSWLDKGLLWNVYGWAFVGGRVAIGGEMTTLAARRSETWRFSKKDLVIHAIVRVRAVRGRRVSFDLVGGAGPQYHFQDSTDSSSLGGNSYLTFSVGADAPIAVTSHFVVSPFTRLFFLDRERTRYESSTSWRSFTAGVSAGVQW